jgi:hypothetical protein
MDKEQVSAAPADREAWMMETERLIDVYTTAIYNNASCFGNSVTHRNREADARALLLLHLRTAAPAVQQDGWIAVNDRLPNDGETVLVYTPPMRGEEWRVDFDGRDDGIWVEHANCREHYMAVTGGKGCLDDGTPCVGPSEDAPYTHWKPITPPGESAGSAPDRCPHCDGTGDVHRADGEWLGACGCEGSAPAEPPEVVIHVVVNGHQRNITIRRDASLRALAINALIEAKVIDYDLSRWVVTTEAGEVLDQSRLVASIDPKATPLFIARTAGIVASSAPAEPAPAPAMVMLTEEETAELWKLRPHDERWEKAIQRAFAQKNGAAVKGEQE